MNPSADPSAVLSTRSHGGREGERVLSLPLAFPLQGRGQQPHEPDTHSHTGLRRLPVLAGLQPYARTEAQGRPGGTLASFTSQLCGATGSGSRIRCPLCLSRIPPSVRSRPIPRVHRIRGLRRVTSHWLSCPPAPRRHRTCGSFILFILFLSIFYFYQYSSHGYPPGRHVRPGSTGPPRSRPRLLRPAPAALHPGHHGPPSRHGGPRGARSPGTPPPGHPARPLSPAPVGRARPAPVPCLRPAPSAPGAC